MHTAAAARSIDFADEVGVDVYTRAELRRMGCTRHEITARIAAHRWRPVGRAVVLHNGELTRDERWRAGVLNCGPRAVLASFSAAEAQGLRGWERPEVHVLAPAGVAPPAVGEIPLVLHRTSRPIAAVHAGTCQPLPAALLLASGSFGSARPACGLLAAGVQQRLVSAAELAGALADAPRARHRRSLLTAVADIDMGAEALSELDFVRLCRRHRLPAPRLQAVRVERDGRRRYLDAEWDAVSGRPVAAEVDGALHLSPRRWYDDQLRHNEVVLSGRVVLRFPSVVVRTEPELVAGQLRRALGCGS